MFDINSIAISNAGLGDSPYFKLPDGYEFTDPDHSRSGNHKGLTADYDKEYFLNDCIYIPQESKTFQGHTSLDRDAKDKAFGPPELQKGFDDLIVKMGGVKINNGKGYKSGEKYRVKELDPHAHTNGYLSSSSYFENIYTYVIRKPYYSVCVQQRQSRKGEKAIIASTLDGNRLTSHGFGSKNPISDNNTEEGKTQNRRVELIKK